MIKRSFNKFKIHSGVDFPEAYTHLILQSCDFEY